uniref:Uncharacterized protein n=1 Tax=Hanusia phi TaxID=3032 RepID=A0A7S0I1D7_9CRYP|mmetsp:Transcript_7954/g.18140  ORF Transcript_7954/g.18140 Transcript_7954/m.18140 type:complete len:268 (+) Transcript_7954:61-864(+)
MLPRDPMPSLPCALVTLATLQLAMCSYAPGNPPIASSQILLVRHAQRIDFAERDWSRDAENPFDPYLTVEGKKEATKLGLHLRDSGICNVVSSPFLRCIYTAQYAATRIEQLFNIDLEPGVGEFLHRSFFPDAIDIDSFWSPTQYLKTFCTYVNDKYDPIHTLAFPESIQELRERCCHVLQKLVEKHKGSKLMIVTHAAFIEIALNLLLPDLPVPEIPEGSITEIVQDERTGIWSIARLGDRSYLDEEYDDFDSVFDPIDPSAMYAD